MKEDICDAGGAEYKERRLLCSSSSTSTSTSTAKKRRSTKIDDGGSGIARACTECGKKFWSWKALFGHMRCHPERQWRGINPPPNFRRQQQQQQQQTTIMTQEDHEVASCLLLLANSTSNIHQQHHHKTAKLKGVAMVDDCSVESPSSYTHFECSSCNKVFGSQQALGGHRASHKNVKGCFANTTIPATARLMTWTGQQQSQGGDYFHHDQAVNEGYGYGDHHHHHHHHHHQGEAVTTVTTADQGHKCSICLKVFTTGQALGGHKRCHWERGDNNNLSIDSSSSQPPPSPPPPNNNNNSLVDLNFPPPLHHVDHPPSSSPLTLDLKLGL